MKHVTSGNAPADRPAALFTSAFLWAVLLSSAVYAARAEKYIPILYTPASASDTNQIVSITYPPLTEREGSGLHLPLPPAQHPRLYLTVKNIPELKEKAISPLLKDCWKKIVDAAAFKTDGYLPLTGETHNNNVAVSNAIEAKAFLYVLDKQAKLGREAVDAVLHYYATLKISPTRADVTREVGRAIVTGSMVYDWCYDLLTEREKTTLIGRMETLATTMEIDWPQIKGSSLTSHTVEAQLSRDMLSLAIATYNEKPIIYNRVAGRIFAEFVPARHFYYPAGYHHQGSAYGAYRFNWEMYATFIFDRMGYPDLYGKEQKKVPYYFIYSRRPDGQLLRNGDDYSEHSHTFGAWWQLGQSAAFLAGSYYNDPIVLAEALKERNVGENRDYLFEFLFFNPKAVTATTKASLPLTNYFAPPFGAMIARTGWEDGIASPSVVAEMKVQVFNFANHQHLDAGSFQLYYKGPMAVQSGVYQGKNGTYGDEHFKNYAQRSIAHNTLLVYDPNENFSWHKQAIRNDGGQRYPNDAHEPMNLNELVGQGYKTGEVLAHAVGPDSIKPEFSYLKGELAEAYSTKVKSVKRSFVFLNFNEPTSPAALIVFDQVTAANKDLKKYWLLHSVEEPTVKGIYTTVKRTGKGYGGKMINTTLLPPENDLVIDKIGAAGVPGAGKEYDVFGTNYPQPVANPLTSSADSAVWRIQVSPKKAATNNVFLNVMQVMDSHVTPPINNLPKQVETDQFTGTQIGNRLVLFSKNGQIITNPFNLKITGTGVVKVLITDVQEGDWKVSSKHTSKEVKNDSQVLYFTISAGDYTISKK